MSTKIGKDIEKIKVLLSLGVSKTEIAKQLGISRQGLHKYLAKNANKLNGIEMPKSLSKYVVAKETVGTVIQDKNDKKSSGDNHQPDLGSLDELLFDLKKDEEV